MPDRLPAEMTATNVTPIVFQHFELSDTTVTGVDRLKHACWENSVRMEFR
jgi:hypothetical protein